MARGDGRIYRRSGSPFLWISYYWRGEEQRESTGVRADEKDADRKALRKLRTRLANVRTGRFHGLDAERITVGELLDAYVKYMENAGRRSVRSVRHHLIPVREFFHGVRAADVSATDVMKFTEERLATKESNATINRRLEGLGAAFRLAVKQERITRVPWIAKLDERSQIRKVFYESAEVDLLVACLPPPLDDVTTLAFRTGMRLGEITGLTWSCVDRGAREIRLATSKSGRGRVIPLEGEIHDLMERAWGNRRYERSDGREALSTVVFHRGDGEPVGNFRKSWIAAHESANLDYRRFHDLRHSFAVHARRAGIPENVIMEMGGWETRSMLVRYDVVNVEDRRAAQRRLAKHLESAPPSNVVSLSKRSDKGSDR